MLRLFVVEVANLTCLATKRLEPPRYETDEISGLDQYPIRLQPRCSPARPDGFTADLPEHIEPDEVAPGLHEAVELYWYDFSRRGVCAATSPDGIHWATIDGVRVTAGDSPGSAGESARSKKVEGAIGELGSTSARRVRTRP